MVPLTWLLAPLKAHQLSWPAQHCPSPPLAGGERASWPCELHSRTIKAHSFNQKVPLARPGFQGVRVPFTRSHSGRHCKDCPDHPPATPSSGPSGPSAAIPTGEPPSPTSSTLGAVLYYLIWAMSGQLRLARNSACRHSIASSKQDRKASGCGDLFGPRTVLYGGSWVNNADKRTRLVEAPWSLAFRMLHPKGHACPSDAAGVLEAECGSRWRTRWKGHSES